MFSEARTESQKVTLDGNHVLYTTLKDNKAAGAAIFLNARHVHRSAKFDCVGDRVAYVDFNRGRRKFRAIAVQIQSSLESLSLRVRL